MTYTHGSKYFYGQEISAEEIKNGYINYRTLASTFSHILCNDIVNLFNVSTIADFGGYSEAELVNGCDYDYDTDKFNEIFQYYIIDNNGFRILTEHTDEIVYYLPCLDIYVWGVTHFGTPWNGVNTDIKIEV